MRVLAVVLVCVSMLAMVDAAKAQSPPAASVTDVAAGAVTLSWQPVERATAYDVFLEGFRDSSQSTSYRFTMLAPCTTYALGVRSRRGTRASAWVTKTATTACPSVSPTPTPGPTPANTPPPTETPITTPSETPTAEASPSPTIQPGSPTGRFTTIAPGGALPSDCAARIRSAPET